MATAVSPSRSTAPLASGAVFLRRPGEAAQLGHLARQRRRGSASTSSGRVRACRSSPGATTAPPPRQADGEQRLARLDRPRGAGRAGRHREAGEVEADQQRLALDAGEGDVGRVGQARRGRRRGRSAPAIAAAAPASKRSRRAAQVRRRAPAARRAASSAAAPKPTTAGTFSVLARRRRSWLPPTRQRRQLDARAHPQGRGAQRAVELVAADRQRVDPQLARTSTGILPTACTASQ